MVAWTVKIFSVVVVLLSLQVKVTTFINRLIVYNVKRNITSSFLGTRITIIDFFQKFELAISTYIPIQNPLDNHNYFQSTTTTTTTTPLHQGNFCHPCFFSYHTQLWWRSESVVCDVKKLKINVTVFHLCLSLWWPHLSGRSLWTVLRE